MSSSMIITPCWSTRLAYTPRGLTEIPKVPTPGWTQTVLYCFDCEGSGLPQREEESGNFYCGPPLLVATNPGLRTRLFDSALASHRLATLAAIEFDLKPPLLTTSDPVRKLLLHSTTRPHMAFVCLFHPSTVAPGDPGWKPPLPATDHPVPKVRWR